MLAAPFAVVVACSSTESDLPRTGGSGDDTGGAAGDSGTSGTGATGGMGGVTGTGATGGSPSGGSSGDGGAGGEGLGGLGGIGGAHSDDACHAPEAGIVTGAEFWGGASAPGHTVTLGAGNIRIADADGLADPDGDPFTFALNPWVSVAAALVPDHCADLSGFASLSVTITTTTELHLHVAVSTIGTMPVVDGGSCTTGCSNHYGEAHVVDGTEVITLTLPLTERTWSDPQNTTPFAQDEVLSLVVMLQPEDSGLSASLPPYDITVSNITLTE